MLISSVPLQSPPRYFPKGKGLPGGIKILPPDGVPEFPHAFWELPGTSGDKAERLA
jgi:hypothetical protein